MCDTDPVVHSPLFPVVDNDPVPVLVTILSVGESPRPRYYGLRF